MNVEPSAEQRIFLELVFASLLVIGTEHLLR